MATIVESGLRVSLVVHQQGEQTLIQAQATSYDAQGEVVRTMTRDITQHVSAARLTGAGALLADVEQYLRNLWEIPE